MTIRAVFPHPRRVQMTRHRPWRCDHPDAVIVARPTIWGNPWHPSRPGKRNAVGKLDALNTRYLLDVPLTAAQVVAWYAAWLDGYALHADARPALLTKQGRRAMWDELAERREAIWGAMDTLRGRDLACWCPLDQPCHADVLLDLANTGPEF